MRPIPGAADLALREIVEEKMGREMPERVALKRPERKKVGNGSLPRHSVLDENLACGLCQRHGQGDFQRFDPDGFRQMRRKT